ncbi:MAG: uracil-DNA glycosylase [Gammaproteobacteria bacterium]|nr:uracil-DNA glycosylase [Gammaproteobacteria bacterium]
MPRLARFLRLIQAHRSSTVFNPWRECDPGTDAETDAPAARRARLRAHLDCDPRLLLLGEAAGYQGCHVSGIPFTSERLLLAGDIPRIAPPLARLSTRATPWSEPSATIVWGALRELGLAERTILWNAFPWHPYRAGNRQSNRTPTGTEVALGRPALLALLQAYPQVHVVAVGRQAERLLSDVGRVAAVLRHPAMGGAERFRAGLRALAHRLRS